MEYGSISVTQPRENFKGLQAQEKHQERIKLRRSSVHPKVCIPYPKPDVADKEECT